MGVDLAWMPSFDFQCMAKLISRVLYVCGFMKRMEDCEEGKIGDTRPSV